MISPFPLWVLFLVRYFQRKRDHGRLPNYAARRMQIESMMRAMAVPQGTIETWLMAKVVGWLTAERDALAKLEQLNISVFLVGSDDHDPSVALRNKRW